MPGSVFYVDVILNGEAEKDPVQKPLQSPWLLILTMPCHPGHSAGVSFLRGRHPERRSREGSSAETFTVALVSYSHHALSPRPQCRGQLTRFLLQIALQYFTLCLSPLGSMPRLSQGIYD